MIGNAARIGTGAVVVQTGGMYMARLTCQSRHSVAMVVGGFEAVVQLVSQLFGTLQVQSKYVSAR
jgi:hypothetical protein